MKIDIKYVDDPETLRRWNFDEPAITFTDENQHVAVPISKVNGYQIKTLLKEWRTPISILLDNIKVVVSGGRVDDIKDEKLKNILLGPHAPKDNQEKR